MSEETGRPKSFRELAREMRNVKNASGVRLECADDVDRLADEWEQLVVRTLQERERDDEPSAWFHISFLQQMLGSKEQQ